MLAKESDFKIIVRRIWLHWVLLGTVAVIDLFQRDTLGRLGFILCVFVSGFLFWIEHRNLVLRRQMDAAFKLMEEAIRKRQEN